MYNVLFCAIRQYFVPIALQGTYYYYMSLFFQLLWRNRVMRYFQNARSRRDNTLQVVMDRKRKSVSTASAKCKSEARPSVALFGLINYLPERPEGETDDTISDLQKIMQTENRKLKPCHVKIEDAMCQTFADRRKLIVTDMVPIPELKSDYPCLFSCDQVCKL